MHLCSWEILAYRFPFLNVCLVLILGNSGFIPSVSVLWNIFWTICILFSLNIWKNSREIIWTWNNINYGFNFLIHIDIFRLYCLLFELEKLRYFKEFVYSIEVINLVGRKLFVIFLYDSFNDHEVSSVVISLDTSYLCLFSFYLSYLARVLTIWLIFSSLLLVSLLFSIDSLFSVSLICALIFFSVYFGFNFLFLFYS